MEKRIEMYLVISEKFKGCEHSGFLSCNMFHRKQDAGKFRRELRGALGGKWNIHNVSILIGAKVEPEARLEKGEQA